MVIFVKSGVKNVAIFNDTRPEKHFGCHRVMVNLLGKLAEYGMRPIFFWPVGKDWRLSKAEIKGWRGVDAIIVNGEGSIHHGADRERARYLSEIALFAEQELGIPAYLINATVYENPEEVYENIRRFSKVFVRESMSLNELQMRGVDAMLAADLTLAYECSVSRSSRRKGAICTDSVLADVTARLRRFCIEADWSYQPVLSNRAAAPWIVRNVMRRIPRSIAEQICQRFEAREADAYIQGVGSKQFVLTGRFHVMTFCLLTQTPFVAVESNTPKITAVLSDVFGKDDRVMPMNRLSLESVEPFFEWGVAELEMVKQYCDGARRRIDDMFSYISCDLERGSRFC